MPNILPSSFSNTAQGSLYSNASSGITQAANQSYSIGAIQGANSISPNSISSASGKIVIDGDCDVKGDLTIDGISLRDQLAKINERLAILVPNPELLAKYETLRNLYEQYKALEALCK